MFNCQIFFHGIRETVIVRDHDHFFAGLIAGMHSPSPICDLHFERRHAHDIVLVKLVILLDLLNRPKVAAIRALLDAQMDSLTALRARLYRSITLSLAFTVWRLHSRYRAVPAHVAGEIQHQAVISMAL